MNSKNTGYKVLALFVFFVVLSLSVIGAGCVKKASKVDTNTNNVNSNVQNPSGQTTQSSENSEIQEIGQELNKNESLEEDFGDIDTSLI